MNAEEEFLNAAVNAHMAAMWRALPDYDRATNTIPSRVVGRERDRIYDESMKLALAGC